MKRAMFLSAEMIRQLVCFEFQNTFVHIEEATTTASVVAVIVAALLFLVAYPGVPRVPDWSEARYSFVLRRGCFLLRR